MPGFLSGERLGAQDRHHIAGLGHGREIHAEVVVGQLHQPEGGPPGDPVQLGAGVGEQPGAVAHQAVEDPLAGQPIRAGHQRLEQGGLILRSNLLALQLLQDPAEGGLAVGLADRPVLTLQGRQRLQVAVVGEHPLLAPPAPVEGVAVLQRHHAPGGLADVGDRAVGLQIQGGHRCGNGREGGRGVLAIEVQALAVGVEAGQPPTIGVVAGGAAPQPQAVEGEADVGGGVGAEGQQFAHRGLGPLEKGDQRRAAASLSQTPPLAKKARSIVGQPPRSEAVNRVVTGAKEALRRFHTAAFTGRKPSSAKIS